MIKKCIECGNDYNGKRKNSKFCSISCKNKYNRFIVQCSYCKKEKIVYRNAFISKKNHFCDNKCQWKWRRENNECVGENHWNKKDFITVKCINCDNKVQVRPDRYNRNKTKIFYCDNKCHNEYKTKQTNEKHFNYSQVKFNCKNCGELSSTKKSQFEKHNNHFCSKKCSEIYSGRRELTPFRNLLRQSKHYKECRKKCLERDNYKSILSGNKGFLHHHHLKSLSIILKQNDINKNNWEEFISILFDIDNIVTLTKEEHNLFHRIYGFKTTKEQFEEFVEKYKGELNV